MEPEIKRINFFDGLFLRQQEFQAEQLYHLHMRRRLNYLLFEVSGVVQVESEDLKITSAGAKSFFVTPGMAVSCRKDLCEGRELILRNNSPTIDLSTSFVAGEKAFVALHYSETPTEAQTIAAPNTPTRLEESATVTVHKAWPPAAPAPGGENYILLGQIDFDTMGVDITQRQTAKLRASLLGGAVSPAGAPSITNVSPATGARSSTVAVTITGTNLSGAVVTSSDPNVTVSGTVATATTVSFSLTIGATANSCTLTVTTATAPPATAPFTVTPAVVTPVLTLVSPTLQVSNGFVSVRGTNIRNPALAVGAQAAGTAITLTFTPPGGPASSKAVPAADITVRPDLGGIQVVRFVVPDRSGTPWGNKETVKLELTFQGVTSSNQLDFQYDD